jgi:hypothetical protein
MYGEVNMLYGLTFGVMVTLMLTILSGCNYGHKQYDPSATNGQPASDGLLVLEVTDYGRFWDRAASDRLYKFLEYESAGKNVVLVTFIHGWHHNAELSDSNRRDFQKTMRELQEKVNTREYADARVALQLQENVKVIGLYIGWRGESLPCYLDYLTFWGRKAAAEQVGGGDLREFLLKLQNLYNERNGNVQTAAVHTFMGMVTIGHSFGGQVALRTVAELLEHDLIDSGVRSEIVTGLGDLTVLLNPALEAHQYERIHRVARNGTYNYMQSPVLLTISADNDFPRSWWFPFGRRVSRLFRASLQAEEAHEWTQALGMYEPHQTHLFEVTNEADTITEEVDSKALDLSRYNVIGGIAVKPLPERSTVNYPFIVARTPSQVFINGHNGIFSDTFRTFLTEFVALSQGKRISVRRETTTSPPPKMTPQGLGAESVLIANSQATRRKETGSLLDFASHHHLRY